jgi:hypothetical protein
VTATNDANITAAVSLAVLDSESTVAAAATLSPYTVGLMFWLSRNIFVGS